MQTVQLAAQTINLDNQRLDNLFLRSVYYLSMERHLYSGIAFRFVNLRKNKPEMILKNEEAKIVKK